MLLVIDAGNSTIKLALAEGDDLGRTRRLSTRGWATTDELEAILDALLGLDGSGLAAADRIALASVVPAASEALAAIAASRGIPIVEAAVGTVPIPVRVERPEEVGPDRLVNALAAGRLYGAPAIVVDLGTATTFDVVGPDGAFLGGAIAPGASLGLDALAAHTARLPRVELREPARAIGRDTVGAMQSGAVFGYMGLAKELLGRLRAELAAGWGPGYITVVATGGLSAAPWVRGIPTVDAVDPELTLKGLLLLADSTWADVDVAAHGPAGAAGSDVWAVDGGSGRGAG